MFRLLFFVSFYLATVLALPSLPFRSLQTHAHIVSFPPFSLRFSAFLVLYREFFLRLSRHYARIFTLFQRNVQSLRLCRLSLLICSFPCSVARLLCSFPLIPCLSGVSVHFLLNNFVLVSGFSYHS